MGTFHQQVYYYDNNYINTFFDNELNYNIEYINKNYPSSTKEFLIFHCDNYQDSQPYMLQFSFNSKNISGFSVYLKWSTTGQKQPIYSFYNIKKENLLNINVVFTPSHSCQNLVFQFTVPDINKSIISPTIQQENCTISNVKIYPVKKLLPDSDNTKITKLGIQGHPFMYAIINGSPVRVGRNGIYEIEGIQIQDLRFAPYAEDSFIVDYVEQTIDNDEESPTEELEPTLG